MRYYVTADIHGFYMPLKEALTMLDAVQGEDDCCMTATTGQVVYVVGKQKPDADKQPKADAKRIAEAVARTAKYVKK